MTATEHQKNLGASQLKHFFFLLRPSHTTYPLIYFFSLSHRVHPSSENGIQKTMRGCSTRDGWDKRRKHMDTARERTASKQSVSLDAIADRCLLPSYHRFSLFPFRIFFFSFVSQAPFSFCSLPLTLPHQSSFTPSLNKKFSLNWAEGTVTKGNHAMECRKKKDQGENCATTEFFFFSLER